MTSVRNATISEQAPPISYSNRNMQSGELVICPCCCCMRQSSISFSVDLNMVDTLGEAATLFFQSIKHCVAMMLVAFTVFSVYSLASNIYAASNSGFDVETSSLDCEEADRCELGQISLGIKLEDKTNLNRDLYLGQTWVGLLLVIVWIGMLIYKTSREWKVQMNQDLQNPSASDFTVMI